LRYEGNLEEMTKICQISKDNCEHGGFDADMSRNFGNAAKYSATAKLALSAGGQFNNKSAETIEISLQ
jgi:hypothetical protein